MKDILASFRSYFAASALLLALSSLLSRVMGVYRDHLFARFFGASADLDAYYAAFRIPDLLYALLIMSSISVVFLPLFQKYKAQEKYEKAWKFTSAVLNSFMLVFLLISLIFIIFTPSFVDLYVSGFSEEQKDLTVKMIRIMMLSPFFFMLSSIMIAVENAFQKFFAQALAPLLYNVGIIGGILFLREDFGIYGVAFGVVFGAVLQMLIQIPFFLQTGFHWSPVLLYGERLKTLLSLIVPRVLSVSVAQVALTVDTIIAAALPGGAIVFLNLATNIQSLPFGMIAISLAITAFASLTHFAAQNNMQEFRIELKKNIEKILFWILPSIAGMYVLAGSIVDFLFVYGKFSTENADILVRLIHIFLLALFFQSLIPLLSRAFFALQKTWLVFFISSFGLVLNIFVSIYLSKIIGVEGIAWGTVTAMCVQMLLLFVFASQQFGKILSFHRLFGIAFISYLMFAFLHYIFQPSLSGFSSFIQILFLGTLGAAFYFGGIYFGKKLYRFYS